MAFFRKFGCPFSFLLVLLCLGCFLSSVSSQTAIVDIIQSPSTVVQSRTITFLSSGYQNKDNFLSDVRLCVSTLYNNTGGVVSDPWSRYISLINVYAVYQYSDEPGVARPISARCEYLSNCNFGSSANNLDCSLGTPNPHALNCNLEKVNQMAAEAPVQDIVVVLVNEDEIGGIASNGVAFITNKKFYMPYLLVHYLNRAVANLHDEYNYGFEERGDPAKYSSPNCVASESAALAEWSYWGITWESLGTACTFANYFSPTQNQCIMKNLTYGRMCSVCKEQLALSLFKEGVENSVIKNSSKSSMVVLGARCPPENVNIYVNRTAGIYLSVGPFSYQNDVEIVWYTEGGQVISNSTRILNLTDVSNWTFPTVIRVAVVDRSPYVRATKRTTAFESSSLFLLYEREEDTRCTFPTDTTCFGDLYQSAPISSMCFSNILNTSRGKDSALETPAEKSAQSEVLKAVSFQSPNETSHLNEAAPPAFDTTNLIVACCVCITIALVYFVIIITVYFTVVVHRPREVLKLEKKDTAIFSVLLSLSIVNFFFSVAVLCLVVTLIPRQFVFGWQLFASGVVVAVCVFFLHFFSICGVLFRWLEFCAVCAAFDVILAIGECVVGVYCVWAHTNEKSAMLGNSIGNLWSASSANRACSLEAELECSGFNVGCFMALSSECPAGCDANLNINGCRLPFMKFMSEQYYPVGIVQIVLGILLAITAVFNALYFLYFKQLSVKGKLRRSFRNMADPPYPPITREEVEVVRNYYEYECKRLRKEALEGKRLIRFVESVFGEALEVEFADVLLAAGPVTFDELMCTYFPFMRESQDPMAGKSRRVSEVELSWDLLDPQRKSSEELYVLKEAVGALSPDMIHSIIQNCVNITPLPTLNAVVNDFRERSTDCAEVYLTTALSPESLEGLRGAWVALNPKLTGPLSDEQLQNFFYWSHGRYSSGPSEFKEWKKSLGVTSSGGTIGWPEFCNKYARKEFLNEAIAYMKETGREIPSGLIAKSAIIERYGFDLASKCLLPFESEIPYVRFLHYLLVNNIPTTEVDIVRMANKTVLSV